VFVSIASIVIILLFFYNVIKPESTSDQSQNSNTSSSQSPSLQNQLDASKLRFTSSGDASAPFDAAQFLEQQFTLTKVEPGKTYGMLCKYVFNPATDGPSETGYGVSVVKVLAKPGAQNNEVQMQTVVAGCLDDAKTAVSMLRLNRDPLGKILTSEDFQFNIEALARDQGVPETGIPVSTKHFTSVAVFPKFSLLTAGQRMRTVKLKKAEIPESSSGSLLSTLGVVSPGGNVGTYPSAFGKSRDPTPFPVFFSSSFPKSSQLPPVAQMSYVQNDKAGEGGDWYLPVGVTCIPASGVFSMYASLFFVNDAKTTLTGAIISGQKGTTKMTMLADPAKGDLGLTFADVLIP